MFTISIHKVVYFFYGHNSNKKRKKRKILFFSFSFQFILFSGVVKMNNCIESHFQDLSTALAIATTCSTTSVYFSLYSKRNRSLLILVIASTKQIMRVKNQLCKWYVLYCHSLFFLILMMCGRERFWSKR